MKNKTQNQLIRQHLEKGKSITPLQALIKFNCLRLSGRIFELKEDGMKIKTEMVKVGDKLVASYSLIDKSKTKAK